MKGKNNIAIGFLAMAVFMAYGFLLIYLRDFAPGKEEWINSYSVGNSSRRVLHTFTATFSPF